MEGTDLEGRDLAVCSDHAHLASSELFSRPGSHDSLCHHNFLSGRWAWPFPGGAGTPLSRSPVSYFSCDLQQRSRKIAQSLDTPLNWLRTVRRREVPRSALLEPGAHQHLPNHQTLSLWPSASVTDGSRPVIFKIFIPESLNAGTSTNYCQII